MSSGFDPERFFENWPSRRRPKVVRSFTGPRRRWPVVVIGVLVLLAILFWTLLSLRVNLLFFESVNHSNVFWTPVVAHVVLFLIGFAAVFILMALNIPFWRAAAGYIDEHGHKIATWIGLGFCALIAVIGGLMLSGQWQDVLLWMHTHSFGSTEPVFGLDFSYFVFTLPFIDDLQGLAWLVAIASLVASAALAFTALSLSAVPTGAPLPFKPEAGKAPADGGRIAVLHTGAILVVIFILAALGAHYGVYHLATTNHDTFVGLDATQRNVLRPVLGILQVVALGFAVLTAIYLLIRRQAGALATASGLGALLIVWLAVAGLSQTIPGAIYQGVTVTPNAQTAQAGSISDFLTVSRAAWGLQTPNNVDVRSFGKPTTPTLQDLSADPGTLRNVRIQDFRELPDTLRQIDTSRSYQTYPTITVDRYPDPANGGETQVMIGPREIAENDTPSGFVNQSLIYTHGYGITAVSVNQVGNEGKPKILAGNQPLQQVAADAPPDLSFNGNKTGDPRIYCGMLTTQPVIANTGQNEFDYPSGSGDVFIHGTGTNGIAVNNTFDKLAISLKAFSGFDVFLTNTITPDSRVLLHRQVTDRISMIAPFLTLDGDPYVVADSTSGHLVWIVDAYIKNSNVPESFQAADGTSYMRNTVKATVDARTCQVNLYQVDPTEPITAAYADIYPGLFQPLSSMPMSLRAHLRYPEDLFSAQAQAYATVHITDPVVLFNRSDLWRPSDELINGQQQATQAYYVEMTLPNDTQPHFVLLQSFSPAQSSGGTSNNNMTAWLAATNDYTGNTLPRLVSVPLNNADNVLGPLQFDNNINTNPQLSAQLTLLGSHGSSVVLGNVIVLPFANHSFLYVRPLYVLAQGQGGGSFPQLQDVIVGTKDSVAYAPSFPEALQNLFKTTSAIPGLANPSSNPTPNPSPGATPTPTPAPTVQFTAQETALVQDWLAHEAAYEADLQKSDFTAAGQEQAAMKSDSDQLRQLLAH